MKSLHQTVDCTSELDEQWVKHFAVGPWFWAKLGQYLGAAACRLREGNSGGLPAIVKQCQGESGALLRKLLSTLKEGRLLTAETRKAS